MTLIIVLVLIGIVLMIGVLSFNRLVRGRNLIREAWSGIDVQLKRRYDLVPNLVKCVEGYAQHEKSVIDNMLASRQAAIGAASIPDQERAERRFHESIRAVVALSERYPNLKANENYLQLQKELAEIEDTIQLARRYYNATVREFNTNLATFPTVLFARTSGFTEEPFFSIDGNEFLEGGTQRETPRLS